MNYKQEIKQLQNAIPEDVLSLLAHEKCFIAGGALTSIFTGTQINDVDIYFRDKESLDRVMQTFCGIQDKNLPTQRPTGFSISNKVQPITITKKSVVFTQGDGTWNAVKGIHIPKASLQFITFQYFESAEDIFDTFDFSINMCAYDCASGELTLHDNFLKHLARRSLVVNTNTAYPLISLLRCDKYKERGYNISTKEQMRLMFAIANMNIDSWEDAKDHIGGMYGFDVEDLFDEEQEFSLDKVISQLKDVERVYDKGIKLDNCRNRESTYTQWKMRERLLESPEDFHNKWFVYTDYTQEQLNKGTAVESVQSKEGDYLQIIEDTPNPWAPKTRRYNNYVYEVQIKNLNKVSWSEYSELEAAWDSTNMVIVEEVDLKTFEELDIIKKA